MFGSQKVILVSITEDLNDRDRYDNPEKLRAETLVKGCRFRPLNTTEAVELGTIASDTWKLTAPPVAAVLNAKQTDEVIFRGVTYQIVGNVRPSPDMNGKPFKATIMCERITG